MDPENNRIDTINTLEAPESMALLSKHQEDYKIMWCDEMTSRHGKFSGVCHPSCNDELVINV